MSALAVDPHTDIVLEARNLVVEFARDRQEPVRPVRGVSFAVERARRLGIVGESGSGKSLTALALMRLLPGRAELAAGEVLLAGRDLTQLDERQMARVRGGQLAIVYQDPMSSLNPLQTVGHQVSEAIRAHESVSRHEARDRTIELFRDVGIPNPERRSQDYPHEFSGGMRQRVMIAMAICANPEVLIADEPTTALDVTTQARIMDLLTRLVEERRMAVLLITHDLGLAASFCDDVHVMYGGRIVERGSASEVFRSPLHPYTEALLESICRLDRPIDEPITAIGGQPPLPQNLPAGCSFHPRCPHAQALCAAQAPVPIQVGDQMAECHFAVELKASRS
jgi:oligopeptide/dipeptide ABC transporter ATP-binding protein